MGDLEAYHHGWLNSGEYVMPPGKIEKAFEEMAGMVLDRVVPQNNIHVDVPTMDAPTIRAAGVEADRAFNPSGWELKTRIRMQDLEVSLGETRRRMRESY